MLRKRAIRALALCCALEMLALIAAAAVTARSSEPPAEPAAEQDQGEAQDEASQDGRRRVVRLVLPWSDLEDLSPRQEAAIREIRAEILLKRDELDRIERERIMEVLTESQRQRVKEIEEQRARDREQRELTRQERGTTRPSGDDGESNP